MAAKLEVAGLEAKAGPRLLVGPVDLTLEPGQGIVLLGQMGAGKSLVLEWLAGVRRPGVEYSGELSVRGGPQSEAAAGTTILVPQDWRLGGLRTDKVHTLLREGGAGVDEWLEHLEVDTPRIQNMTLGELASSERWRVLFACALARQAAALLVDGAFEVLDPRQRQLAMSAMEAAVSSGKSLVVSARDQAWWAPEIFRRVQLGPPLGTEPVAVPLVQKRKPGSRAVATHPVLDIAGLEVERHVRGLWGRGKAALVVDGASLFVRKGEILALLGPSGSGKSTLLGAMAGIVPCLAGRVRVSGVDVTVGRGRAGQRTKGVELVSQEVVRALDRSQSVEQHLLWNLPKGSPAEVERWLDRLGLPGQVAHISPDVLSEGEGFRLALALALGRDPRVVLLDAPRSGALDTDGGTLTLLLLAEKARDKSFVVATSDPGILRPLADRIAIIDAGRILEFGPTALVLGKPAHPRTVELLRSAPGPHHDPRAPREGCHMAGHCPREVERCQTQRPPLDFVPGATRNHRVACFNPNLDQLEPKGLP